jgi:hypothetical protein
MNERVKKAKKSARISHRTVDAYGQHNSETD